MIAAVVPGVSPHLVREDRHRIGERDRRITVEERRHADTAARPQHRPGDRQPLQSRDQQRAAFCRSGAGRLGRKCRRRVHPIISHACDPGLRPLHVCSVEGSRVGLKADQGIAGSALARPPASGDRATADRDQMIRASFSAASISASASGVRSSSGERTAALSMMPRARSAIFSATVPSMWEPR